MPLEVAEKRPLTTDLLSEQLGRLGGTPFKIGRLDARLADAVVLPISELNRIRRSIGRESWNNSAALLSGGN